jgi:PAS domain S-box-containing protein
MRMGLYLLIQMEKFFWCNDAYLKLTGYSKEEVIGRTPIGAS